MSYNNTLQQFTGAAVDIRCPSCFLQFAIPRSLSDAFYEKLHNVRQLWCPSCGRTMIPNGKTEAERLRDDLAREKHRAEQAQARADANHRKAQRMERKARAARGQVTKIKNRVKNGVCPLCRRSFPALQKHMETEHPHYCGGKQERRLPA